MKLPKEDIKDLFAYLVLYPELDKREIVLSTGLLGVEDNNLYKDADVLYMCTAKEYLDNEAQYQGLYLIQKLFPADMRTEEEE